MSIAGAARGEAGSDTLGTRFSCARLVRSDLFGAFVATEDRMIPPDAQRAMSKRAGSTVVEAKGSHAVYVSQPESVAAIITKAARGVALVTR